MTKRDERTRLIIDQTIQLLRDEGSEGLTLRKVAAACGITLSNLQYYFPGKAELIQATVAQFFTTCKELIQADRALVLPKDPESSRAFLKRVIEVLVVCDNQEFNVIFREIWALSSRDEALKATLEAYYRDYAQWMISLIEEIFPQANEIVSLLIPYAEGYALVGNTLPLNREKQVGMLVKLITEWPASPRSGKAGARVGVKR
jgi:AcrR family transcriptional regulator